MNNACPTCGAVYAVEAKDVGRRIRCKKCNTKLLVTEAGLAVAPPNRGAAAAAPPAPNEAFDIGDDTVGDAPRQGRSRRPAANIDPSALLARVGGIPAILFGFGVFLMIFTGFQQAIGAAKVDRRQGAIDEGELEMKAAQHRYDEKKEKKQEDDNSIAKSRENWEKRKRELEVDKAETVIANKRSAYFDRYIFMLGCLLVAFGCLGFLQTDHGLLLRVVAAVILVSMILALFKGVTGGGAGVGASLSLG